MTRDEIAALFDARQQHWNARDPEALAQAHAEDGVVHSPMFGVLHGRPAIAESYRTLFKVFPDWQFTGDVPVVDGHRVSLPFSVEATHVGEFMGLPGTNRRFRIVGVRLLELADGLITTERRLYDFTGLLVQVGVLKSKPGF